jgi:hypothetical protein
LKASEKRKEKGRKRKMQRIAIKDSGAVPITIEEYVYGKTAD